MIEEILKPEDAVHIGIMVGFACVVLFATLFLIFKYEKHGFKIALVIMFIFMVVIIWASIENLFNDTEWREQVEAQIELLSCEDMQEADEIYGFDSIKEKFLFECVDTREGWWK